MLKITKYLIERPKVANLILVFIFLIGYISMSTTRNQGYPNVDFGVTTITTVYPGASPEDVETKVTAKIEDELESISGIDEMRSYSIENVSVITIKLDGKADFDDTKRDIQKAVDRVNDLPEDIENKPVVFELNNDAIPVAELTIIGDADTSTKRRYAKALEDKISVNPLVGKIIKIGYRDREVIIEADNQKLQDNYLDLNSLANAISAYNFRISAGDLKSNNQEKIIVIDSEFPAPADVGDVIIRSGFDGNRIKVSDVAIIKDGYEDLDNIIKFNGQSAINLKIEKKPASDIVETTTAIKEIITDFKKTLPENVQVKLVVDYSEEVNSLLKLVTDNALLGFVLVIIALMMFLNRKVAFWTALGIPTSVLIAFTFFPSFDITINFITLIAFIIVLGMLVDDAVLVGENIFYHREQGMDPKEAALKGTQEVMWPVITTVLTTVVAFLPMFFMTGTMGQFMQHMPLVVTFALIGSLIESLFILPSHMAHTKIVKKERKIRKVFKKLEDKYEALMVKLITQKAKTIATFILILIISALVLIFGIKFRLFPSDDGIIGYVQFETRTGTSLEETKQRAKPLEALIISTLKKNELNGIITNIGERSPSEANNFISLESSESHLGNIVIHFSHMKNRNRTSRELIKEIKKGFPKIEGFEKLEIDVVSDGPPVGKPITVRFVSNNDPIRVQMAAKLVEFLKTQTGISNIGNDETEGKEELSIKLNYDIISRVGLTPIEVANTLRTAYDGIILTTLRREGEEIDYRVRLNTKNRSTLDTLRTLTVKNKQDKLIPISQLVTIVQSPPIKTINHFDGDRAITITADLDPEIANAAEINHQISKLFSEKIKPYPDLRMIFGGEEKETQESMASLFRALTLALVGIYFILVILFNSFIQPFLVMLTIPYSFAGVVFAFFIQGYPLSFPAAIGMIGLVGVVVNNALVMISFLNNKVKESDDSPKSLAAAAKRRLRPILLTTITTAAGLFPSAYGFGGDNPVIIPMITAIAWGLIFSTIISLILIPAVYSAQRDFQSWVFNRYCDTSKFCIKAIKTKLINHLPNAIKRHL